MSEEKETMLFQDEVVVDEIKEEKLKTKKVKEEKKVEIKEETKKKVLPKLFISQDEKVLIEVDCFYNNETGELSAALPKEYSSSETFDSIFTKLEHKFWFTRVSYDKLNRYRTRSMIYNSEDKNNTINQLKLREYFWIFHFVDWNLEDENGKIELKFDPNKALSDESLKLVFSLPSNLLDLVMALFEKKINIS